MSLDLISGYVVSVHLDQRARAVAHTMGWIRRCIHVAQPFLFDLLDKVRYGVSGILFPIDSRRTVWRRSPVLCDEVSNEAGDRAHGRAGTRADYRAGDRHYRADQRPDGGACGRRADDSCGDLDVAARPGACRQRLGDVATYRAGDETAADNRRVGGRRLKRQARGRIARAVCVDGPGREGDFELGDARRKRARCGECKVATYVHGTA